MKIEKEVEPTTIHYRIGGLENKGWSFKKGLVKDILISLQIKEGSYYNGVKSGLKIFSIPAVIKNGRVSRPTLEIRNLKYKKG